MLPTPPTVPFSATHLLTARDAGAGSEEGEALLREGGGTLRGARRQAFGTGGGASSRSGVGGGDGDGDEEVCVALGSPSLVCGFASWPVLALHSALCLLVVVVVVDSFVDSPVVVVVVGGCLPSEIVLNPNVCPGLVTCTMSEVESPTT